MDEIYDRTVPVFEDSLDLHRTRVQPNRMGLNGFRELVRVNFDTTRAPIEEHIHPDAIEICYFFRGHQTYAVQEKEYALSGGDVYVSYPNEVHSSGNAPQSKGELLYYMIIDTLNDADRFMGLDEATGRYLANALNHLRRHFYVGFELKQRLDTMLELYVCKPPMASLLLRCHAVLLFHDLIERSEREQPNISLDMLRLLEYVEDRLSDPPGIEEMAGFAHMSPSYLKRRFRTEVGVTPAKYVMRRRIHEAKHLLLEGLSITETAHELGFSSSQHFSQAFHAHERVAPRDWKRMQGTCKP